VPADSATVVFDDFMGHAPVAGNSVEVEAIVVFGVDDSARHPVLDDPAPLFVASAENDMDPGPVLHLLYLKAVVRCAVEVEDLDVLEPDPPVAAAVRKVGLRANQVPVEEREGTSEVGHLGLANRQRSVFIHLYG